MSAGHGIPFILVMLGNAFSVKHLMESSKTIIQPVLKEKSLYWLTQSDCVLAEIVGFNKAQEYLLDKLGDTANTPNVYEQNRELIHSYFHPNTITSILH